MNRKIKKYFGNNFLYLLWSVLNKEESTELRKNNNLKNIHRGERCFILGNGPSLKNENLEALRDEVVFTVNQFCRSSLANIIKPDYHFWADDTFFEDDESDASKEIINCMRGINSCNPKSISFFPIKHKEFLEKHSISNLINYRYFYSPLDIEDHMKEEIDYSRFTYSFGTVVQWCITMAIYMGFKKIYLLGCDNTQIITIMKSSLMVNDEQDYVYKYSDTEKKRMEKMVRKKPLEDFLRTYINNLHEYRLLNEYCVKRDIQLINLTSSTLIDSIPRGTLSDVLNI